MPTKPVPVSAGTYGGLCNDRDQACISGLGGSDAACRMWIRVCSCRDRESFAGGSIGGHQPDPDSDDSVAKPHRGSFSWHEPGGDPEVNGPSHDQGDAEAHANAHQGIHAEAHAYQDIHAEALADGRVNRADPGSPPWCVLLRARAAGHYQHRETHALHYQRDGQSLPLASSLNPSASPPSR